jgi:integrase
MSVYRDTKARRRTFTYDFVYQGRRYRGNTFQEERLNAELMEAQLKLRLRKERGGIAEPPPSPALAAWAGVYYTHCELLQQRTGRPKRLDRIDEQLRVVLRFFGARPTAADDPLQPREGEEAPFHDCTLEDLVTEPDWLIKFDEWIDRRNVAGSTRNHYYTTMSRLYAVAMLPKYRKQTGVTTNPFTGIPRARQVTRKVVLTPALLTAWLGAMSFHTRLAVAIAALAPKLRLRNILALERARHIDAGVTRITVHEHKSDVATGEPLIVPISDQLRDILRYAFEQMRPGTTHVVQYRGAAVVSIRGSLIAAARDAGIPYGRFTAGGVTFHTLRHTASTLLAKLGVNPWIHRDALGHQELTTTDGYTHLQIEEQRQAHEQLAAALPIAAVVNAARHRAARLKAPAQQGDKQGTGDPRLVKNRPKSAALTRGALILPGRPFGRNRAGIRAK